MQTRMKQTTEKYIKYVHAIDMQFRKKNEFLFVTKPPAFNSF